MFSTLLRWTTEGIMVSVIALFMNVSQWSQLHVCDSPYVEHAVGPSISHAKKNYEVWLVIFKWDTLPQLRMCMDFRMTLSLNLWKCLPVSIKFVNFASLIWFHFNHQPNRSWSFNRKLPHLRKAALSWLSTAQPSFNNDLQRNHLVPLITSRLFWIYISPYKNFALKTVFYDFKGFFLEGL